MQWRNVKLLPCCLFLVLQTPLPRGYHVLIVNDLVQSGGTLKECQKLLSSQVTTVTDCRFCPSYVVWLFVGQIAAALLASMLLRCGQV